MEHFAVSVFITAFNTFLFIADGEILDGFAEKAGVVSNAHLVHVDLEHVVEKHDAAFVGNHILVLGVGVNECVCASVAVFLSLINLGDVAVRVGNFEIVAAFGAFQASELAGVVVFKPPFVVFVAFFIIFIVYVNVEVILIGICT